jgi:hypothetical protein
MTDNSPTDNGSGATGDQNASLPVQPTNPSAEERQDAASSGNTHDAGQSSNESRNESTHNDDDSSTDEGLASFAKGQGFDNISDFSERELELLRRQKKQVDKFRNDPERIKQHSQELDAAVTEIHEASDEELGDGTDPVQEALARSNQQIAQLKAEQRLDRFRRERPDAVEYESDMRDIILQEQKMYGIEAARALAANLPRLYREAKALREGDGTESAREEGRREERELLRKRQEAGAESHHAQSPSPKGPKVTREWIKNEYNPSNPEHRAMVDEAVARGELY